MLMLADQQSLEISHVTTSFVESLEVWCHFSAPVVGTTAVWENVFPQHHLSCD